MLPRIALDAKILAQNFLAWQAFAGVRVRPVIKANGYNWGFRTLVGALDDLCETYCVSDFDELIAVRAHTGHPVVVLSSIPVARLGAALDAGAIPTVCTDEDLEAVSQWSKRSGRKPRIRVGLLPAAGWSGIDRAALERLTPKLAGSGCEIEVWSHVSDRSAAQPLFEEVARAAQTITRSGGIVAGTDLSSTYPVAEFGAMGTAVRIGIGLFGATGGTAVPGVRCALRVSAPVVKSEFFKAGTKVGYGERKMGQDGTLLTLRCGYADGLPKSLAGSSDILSVGMQYAIVRPPGEPFGGNEVSLLHDGSDLDAFAAAAGTGAHQIVTALGNARTGQYVTA